MNPTSPPGVNGVSGAYIGFGRATWGEASTLGRCRRRLEGPPGLLGAANLHDGAPAVGGRRSTTEPRPQPRQRKLPRRAHGRGPGPGDQERTPPGNSSGRPGLSVFSKTPRKLRIWSVSVSRGALAQCPGTKIARGPSLQTISALGSPRAGEGGQGAMDAARQQLSSGRRGKTRRE